MNTIKLSDIIVPKSFEESKPNQKKIDRVREYVNEHGKLDKPIVLDGNMLTDSYVRYLVAIECGFEKVPYITSQEYRDREIKTDTPMTYIAGKFEGNEKEYFWKVTKDISIEVKDNYLTKENSF